MFAHEKLIAYQKSIKFVSWTQPINEELPSKVSARNQLDRASTSIPLNMAEGNGKFSIKDRARYWQTSYGSTLECAACLDVLAARKMITNETLETGKALLLDIVNLMLGLLNHLGCRLDEEQATYGFRIEGEGDAEGEGEKSL